MGDAGLRWRTGALAWLVVLAGVGLLGLSGNLLTRESVPLQLLGIALPLGAGALLAQGGFAMATGEWLGAIGRDGVKAMVTVSFVLELVMVFVWAGFQWGESHPRRLWWVGGGEALALVAFTWALIASELR